MRLATDRQWPWSTTALQPARCQTRRLPRVSSMARQQCMHAVWVTQEFGLACQAFARIQRLPACCTRPLLGKNGIMTHSTTLEPLK